MLGGGMFFSLRRSLMLARRHRLGLRSRRSARSNKRSDYDGGNEPAANLEDVLRCHVRALQHFSGQEAAPQVSPFANHCVRKLCSDLSAQRINCALTPFENRMFQEQLYMQQ